LNSYRAEPNHLIDYWRVVYSRRWVVLMFLIVTVSVVALLSFLAEPMYTASVRIQIERSTPNVLPFQDVVTLVPDHTNDFDATQVGLIRSRRLAREVIRSLKVARHDDFRMEGVPEEIADSRRVNTFLGRLRVEPYGKTSLFDISFRSRDPELAARVATRVAETYIAFCSEARYNTSERATESLTLQIADLHEEIDRKEKEIQGYAREHGIIPLDQNEDITLKNLADLRSAQIHSKSDRIESEAIFKAIEASDSGSLEEVVKNAAVQKLAGKLAELERHHAQLSAKVKPDWPEMVRLNREIEATRTQLDDERQRIYEQVLGTAENTFLAAREEESAMEQAIEEETRRYQELSLKKIRYDSLKSEISDMRETLGALVKRQTETDSSAGVHMAASNARIVDPAEVPLSPSSPRTRLNLLLATFVGLLLGVGLAFLLEYLDLSINSPEEIHRVTGLGTIGLVPVASPSSRWRAMVPGAKPDGRQRVELTALQDIRSPVSEAFREMRTALMVSQAGGPPRTVLVTSSQPGEGKTAVSLNLALTLVQLGRRTLLVDADLRKPRLHRLLGTPNEEGFSSYLGAAETTMPLPLNTEVSGLDLLPSGPLPPNPSDLLDSERFTQVMNELLARGYDHLILDSPPILPVADPVIMSRRVDGVCLVVGAGVTRRDAVAHAMERLRQVDARVIGAVLNRAEEGKGGYYGARYQTYGQEPPSQAPANVTSLHREKVDRSSKG
jgi:polysaccharide biosynthesis transport protein